MAVVCRCLQLLNEVWGAMLPQGHSKLQIMRKEFPFEKLEVWQDARKLVKSVYECTDGFPPSERFGLTSELGRSAVSVANNLAEGSGRSSLKDQAHFSSQAYASLMETACDLILATDLSFSVAEEADPILNQTYDLSVRVHNLRESQLRRAAQT
jgi:four helix bundle protein